MKIEVSMIIEMSEERSYEPWCDEILISLQRGEPIPNGIKVIDCESLGIIEE
jgi:hypothetical protein